MNFIAGLLILAVVFFPAKQLTEPVVGEFMDCCTFNHENGLQLGDRLLKIDGEKIYITNDVSLLLNLNPTGVHDLEVERGGEKVVLNDLPMAHTHLDENGEAYLHYGFSFGKAVEATFSRTVKYIWNTAIDYVRMVRLSLRMLFSGQAGFQDLGGPVMIVQQMAQTAQSSSNAYYAFLNMMNFGALIAVNLAVMNLLPIPALDGGRAVVLLLTTAIEAITKKKINPKYEAYIHGAGMILLLILMAVIFLKDIIVLFKR